jgi:predicted MFS family arabinose efflux permease
VAAINAIAQGIFGTLYTLFFVNELGFTPGPLGVIYATGGAASFFGAAVSVRAAERLGPGSAMTLGLLGWGVGYALVSFAHGAGALSIGLLVAQQLIGDFSGTIYSVTHLTLVQQIAPPEKLGRVLAGIRFLRLCAILAGAGLSALLGAAIGLRYVIAVGAILVICAGVLIFYARVDAD